MTTSAPKKLTIAHLRGSVLPFTLSFEKGKKLTVIYGENGAGKSTICDALEFMGKGKVGSIEKRGLGKTNPYWHSLGKKPSDVSVTLETEISTCCATISKSEVVVSPADKPPRVEVLRRTQILSLIEATPAARYESIKRFIDVSEVEVCEESLRESIKSVRGEQQIALARIEENRQSVEKFWEEAGKPGAEPLVWAETESKRDITSFEVEANSLDALQKTYDRLKVYPTRLEDADQKLKAALQSSTKAQENLEKCVQGVTAEASDTVLILESAKKFLSLHPDPPVCPVCESKNNVSGLSDRINERLNVFKTLREVQARKREAEQEVQLARQRVETVKQESKKPASEFENARSVVSLPKDTLMPTTVVPTELYEWDAWLKISAKLPVAWKKAETARRDSTQFLSTLKKVLQTYKDNLLAVKELAVLLPKLERVLEIVGQERRQFTDTALATIANEVGRLYEAVHPGEGLNKISIALDPGKRASLEMGASFLDLSNAPPQAYFSDSHLDTLGLCVFFALAALEKPDETILVLDDILGSVDEPHVDRLIEMLYQEAMRFRHCIITTHYRPWKQKLRWGWLQNGQCHFVELTKWTPRGGITLIHAIPDVGRLRQLLNEATPDPQIISAKAGVILEAVLDFLTLLYQCPVPRRPDNAFTLGDLLPAVNKRLRQALKVEVFSRKDPNGTSQYNSIPLAPFLDELERIAQVRNVFGCHFSDISFDLLESDAIGFGDTVLKLAGALTDEETGWPRNGRSGSYWATSGETRRLHPYARPS